MNSTKSKIITRLATDDDVGELCELLNQIIRIGGTTAIEAPLTHDEFGEYFLHDEGHLCCFLAIDGSGDLAGFQTLERQSKLPADWVSIATFARVKPKVAGVGTALFAKSEHFARQSGIVAINATIRADNEGGLIFYEKMGFRTYSVNKDIPLGDDTKVDRISKKFDVV